MSYFKKRFLSIVMSMLLIHLPMLQASSTDFIFVSAPHDSGIFRFPSSGPFPYDFTVNPPNPVVTGFSLPSGLTFSPDGTRIFVASFGGGVYTFPSAGPFPLSVSTSIVTGLSATTAVAISPDGTTGFIADVNAQHIYSFPTDPTTWPYAVGAPVVVNLPPVSVYCMEVTPDGQYILVGADSPDAVYIFPIAGPFPYDATTPPNPIITGVPGGFTVNDIAFSSDGETAFITNFDQGTIYAFPTAGPFPIDVSTATPAVTGLPTIGPGGLTLSVDGSTFFVNIIRGGGIYAFPADGPFPLDLSTASPAVTGVTNPWGITSFFSGLPSPKIDFTVTGKAGRDSFLMESNVFVKLYWTSSSNETFNIYRDSKLVGTVRGQGSLKFTDNNLKSKKTYTYRVVALSSAGSPIAEGVLTIKAK